MSHPQFLFPRLRTIGFPATFALVLSVATASQPPQVESPKSAEDNPPNTVPEANTQAQTKAEAGSDKEAAGRQPGDDVAKELKDPIKETDPKKIEARAAYMEGLAAQKKGDLNDAQKAFARAAEADPTAVEPVRAHAVLLRRLGKIAQAEAMARKAIELDQDDYEMRLELAGLLLSRSKPDEASALIDDAL
ncbi:MAG: tetratricopeptide repeat protein [Planctomycetaceae bacterium]